MPISDPALAGLVRENARLVDAHGQALTQARHALARAETGADLILLGIASTLVRHLEASAPRAPTNVIDLGARRHAPPASGGAA